MANSQKDENRLGLYAALLANATVLYCLITTHKVEPSAWLQSLANYQLAIPAVVGLAFVTMLNSLVPTKAKERLVFWEWTNPLPGSRAFTSFLPNDPRIDAAALEARFGPFPASPKEQNICWYRIYTSVRDDPAIVTQRRTYLFSRDYAVLLVLMLLVLGPIAFMQIRSPLLCIGYTAFLIVQYAIAVRSARVTADRWVTTAMAIAAAK